MDLFHFQEEGPGTIFWHPKGWSLFQTLIGYMRRRQEQAGYIEVNTPMILDRSLWETSGHWQTYRDNMFVTTTEDERVFALKPMNCPGHVQIFKNGLKSYRDLPLKIAEFGTVHRYEPSGALHGVMRVRAFTQDDAHIFCTDEQIMAECLKVNDLILSIYADFGFDDVTIKLSTRPEKRVGSDEVWDKAEAALGRVIETVAARGIPTAINPGEGAFYGPKLEYVLRDAIGRDWQCGTLQVDFNLPGRFGAFYIDPHSDKVTPVMLHRAMFGSLERFTGILIEHFAGHMPLWLSPVQAVVATITEEAGRLRAGADRRGAAPGVAGRGRPAQREDQLQGPRTFAGQDPGAARRRPQGGGGADRLDAPARLPGPDRRHGRGRAGGARRGGGGPGPAPRWRSGRGGRRRGVSGVVGRTPDALRPERFVNECPFALKRGEISR